VSTPNQTSLSPQDELAIYRELNQNVPAAFFQLSLTPDGIAHFLFVSRGIKAITGEDPDELVNPNLPLNVPIVPELRESFRTSMMQAASTMSIWYWEGQAFKKNGEIFWLRSVARPRLREGGLIWDGVFIDVTESVRAQQAEREAAEQQAIIREQSQMLAELSTPLIPISDGVLVMPLIGAISDRRAQQVMETLLEGIVHYQAETVLLDITGVKMVDTSVANALIQVARAVNLIGAHLVLTGIQPRIAQTLVQLGVSLGDIVTYSTLQAGIASILTRQRQVVLEVGRRGGS